MHPIISKKFTSSIALSSVGFCLPKKVKIIEVGPRDGLQNEKQNIPTDVKLNFIKMLCDAGCPTVEATSFVSPKWVPQMSDHIDIVKRLPIKEYPSIHFPVLTPNLQGFEKALELGVKEVAIFTACSETFNKKNINCSIEESFKRFEPIMELSKKHNIKVRGYLSTVLGCPYEGEVDAKKASTIVKQLLDIGCYEVSIGDTIGCATPGKVAILLNNILEEMNGKTIEEKKRNLQNLIAVHFHNTYGFALANIFIALQYGINKIDSATGGIGGCPYAIGAKGNVATEEVVAMLHSLGIETNIDLLKIVNAGKYIIAELKRDPITRVTNEYCTKYNV